MLVEDMVPIRGEYLLFGARKATRRWCNSNGHRCRKHGSAIQLLYASRKRAAIALKPIEKVK
jgi:hypothetical protein